jgi:hypothetical protein
MTSCVANLPSPTNALLVFMEGCSDKIGGPNKTVESKFGRRKHHRGHPVRGQWVFGGVVRESRRTFLVPEPDRSPLTSRGVSFLMDVRIIHIDELCNLHILPFPDCRERGARIGGAERGCSEWKRRYERLPSRGRGSSHSLLSAICRYFRDLRR